MYLYGTLGAKVEGVEIPACHAGGSECESRRSRMCLDIKMFPDRDNKNCKHTIGLYKSGRCRACGFKVTSNLRKRAYLLGLSHLVRTQRYETYHNEQRGGWSFIK